MEFHVFSDASEKAYGAAIYVRSILEDGIIAVRLLCAKSKVAPTKKTTLPRLELCAARLATKLANKIQRDLRNPNIKTWFWTESEIVLAWINVETSSFHTFVANRVAAIQRCSNAEQWKHVRSKDNPADIISRGIAPEKLPNCSMWFFGPIFLHEKGSNWPENPKFETEVERRKPKAIALTTSQEESWFNRISYNNSLYMLQKIIAYVQRFILIKTKRLKFPKKLTT